MTLAIEYLPTPLVLSPGLISELDDVHNKLRASAKRSGSAVIVHAGGEVDAFNEPTWRRLLDEAATATPEPGPLVIDTDDFDFMACCAVAAMAEQADRCRGRGVRLHLVSRKPIVTRLLVAARLTGLQPVHPSIESALAG